MATLTQVLLRIETRLSLAVGLDVQIHAEERLLEMVREVYTTLVDTYTWMMPETLLTVPVVNGLSTTDLTALVYHYYDITEIYLDDQDKALPYLNKATNPTKIREYCHGPTGVAATVFQVYPSTWDGNAHIWFRTRLADSVFENQVLTTEIPIDDLLIINGVCAAYLADDGSNDDALKAFRAGYLNRTNVLQKLHQNKPMSKRDQSISGVRDRWE